MSPTFVNLADLVDQGDPAGRTFRQINAAKSHSFPVGTLVELENGARLFVAMQTRDCDQTPLYSLAADPADGRQYWLHGFGEDGLTDLPTPPVDGEDGQV